jgi:hypothetical protein
LEGLKKAKEDIIVGVRIGGGRFHLEENIHELFVRSDRIIITN